MSIKLFISFYMLFTLLTLLPYARNSSVFNSQCRTAAAAMACAGGAFKWQ